MGTEESRVLKTGETVEGIDRAEQIRVAFNIIGNGEHQAALPMLLSMSEEDGEYKTIPKVLEDFEILHGVHEYHICEGSDSCPHYVPSESMLSKTMKVLAEAGAAERRLSEDPEHRYRLKPYEYRLTGELGNTLQAVGASLLLFSSESDLSLRETFGLSSRSVYWNIEAIETLLRRQSKGRACFGFHLNKAATRQTMGRRLERLIDVGLVREFELDDPQVRVTSLIPKEQNNGIFQSALYGLLNSAKMRNKGATLTVDGIVEEIAMRPRFAKKKKEQIRQQVLKELPMLAERGSVRFLPRKANGLQVDDLPSEAPDMYQTRALVLNDDHYQAAKTFASRIRAIRAGEADQVQDMVDRARESILHTKLVFTQLMRKSKLSMFQHNPRGVEIAASSEDLSAKILKELGQAGIEGTTSSEIAERIGVGARRVAVQLGRLSADGLVDKERILGTRANVWKPKQG